MKPTAKPDYWGFIGLIVILAVNSFLILLSFFNEDEGELVISRHTYVLSGLLVTEVFLYWFMRYHIYNKWWVKMHVICFALGFIIFPFLINLIGIATIPIDASDIEYMQRIILIAKIDVVAIYSTLIIAHIFFALTLFKSFTFKKVANNNDEAPGLLDEFIN